MVPVGHAGRSTSRSDKTSWPCPSVQCLGDPVRVPSSELCLVTRTSSVLCRTVRHASPGAFQKRPHISPPQTSLIGPMTLDTPTPPDRNACMPRVSSQSRRAVARPRIGSQARRIVGLCGVRLTAFAQTASSTRTHGVKVLALLVMLDFTVAQSVTCGSGFHYQSDACTCGGGLYAQFIGMMGFYCMPVGAGECSPPGSNTIDPWRVDL